MGSTAAQMSETELTDAVMKMAQLFGWRRKHDRPAQNRRGDWATHMQGDVGFPDLVLARDGFVLFIEFKSEMGKFTDEQFAWGMALKTGRLDATHAYHEWRPSEWLDGTIEKVLKRERNR